MSALVYPDALIARILRSANVIALVGASTNWNRPSFFVMKYLQVKGYRVIPVNPAVAGQNLLGETIRASLSEIGEPGGHGGCFPPLRRRARDRRRGYRHWRQGRVDAIGRAARRGCGQGAGRRPDRHHGPLPEDRIRSSRRRIVLVGRQFLDRFRQAAAGAEIMVHAVVQARRRGERAGESRLRLRDSGDPRRRGAGPDDRRANHADLPDGLLCFRGFRSGGCLVQYAQLRPCL